mmetsp:Transcript_22032/g.53324  ORF Transcript_22032/g.53324 Transcript_22032/m.53324 type:complete len:237 (+) Transcript_22032:753-1463(+)
MPSERSRSITARSCRNPPSPCSTGETNSKHRSWGESPSRLLSGTIFQSVIVGVGVSLSVYCKNWTRGIGDDDDDEDSATEAFHSLAKFARVNPSRFPLGTISSISKPNRNGEMPVYVRTCVGAATPHAPHVPAYGSFRYVHWAQSHDPTFRSDENWHRCSFSSWFSRRLLLSMECCSWDDCTAEANSFSARDSSSLWYALASRSDARSSCSRCWIHSFSDRATARASASDSDSSGF